MFIIVHFYELPQRFIASNFVVTSEIVQSHNNMLCFTEENIRRTVKMYKAMIRVLYNMQKYTKIFEKFEINY